ncbi:MAG: FAD-dependent oxidoreductase [Bacillota bacterium]|nr:FAD-dependent oxidoreductase [Bacillota bacterium]
MKILVVGGVAAGTKAAAKLKREMGNEADVTVITLGKYISYAACGLPYYIGQVIKEKETLLENTPESFTELTGVPVLTGIEATKLDRAAKTVFAKNIHTGEELTYDYDKLVIATGARPVKPNLPGIELKNIFTLRDPDDADAIKAAVASGEVKRAVIVGGGAIGLEMAENLTGLGVRASIIDMAPHILPGFDGDFAAFAEDQLAEHGIPTLLGDSVVGFEGEGRVQKLRTAKRAIKTDMVIMSVGVRPNTEWLADSGLNFVEGTRILDVDDHMRTNDEDIYAVGDCAMVKSLVTGNNSWTPMGSTANIAARLCAKAIAGTTTHGFRGVLGTNVLQLPGVNVGKAGLGIEAAKAAGIDIDHVTITCYDKAKFYPDMEHFSIRLVAEKATRKLIGVQVFGKGTVDKIVDIGVTAISLGATIDKFDDMDFAYSPPFSSVIHPFAIAAEALENKMNGNLEGDTFEALMVNEDWVLLDVGKTPVLPALRHVAVGSINGEISGVPTDKKVALFCLEGKNSYMAQNRMKRYGYENVSVVEGGTMFNFKTKDELGI